MQHRRHPPTIFTCVCVLLLTQAIYSSAEFEDKLDLLRARLPGRSSQELRQLLHQADGELHAVLAQVQTPPPRK